MKKNLKYILGIQSYANHDAAACILKFDNKGKILEYVSITEDRLLRKKHTYAFPLNSIMYCLNYFNLKNLKQVDYIFSDWIKIKQWLRSGPSYNYQEFDYIKENLNFDKNKIYQIDHHLAHAATAFYPSGYNDASILIADGLGSDGETQSYFAGKKNKIRLIERQRNRGIGAAYAAVTEEILKMGTGGEGKTMGLAPYGKNLKKKFFKFKNKGIKTDFSNFVTRHPHSDVLNHVDKKFKIPKLKIKFKKFTGNYFNQYFANIAYEIQSICEKTMIHLGNDLFKKNKSNNICLAGGCALNSVANHKLIKNSKFKNMFVFPAASDCGIPLGLVLWGYYNFYKGKKKKINFSNACFSKEYSNEEVLKDLKKFKINFDKFDAPKTAELISKGKVIGRFYKSSESGPRALGNRSILADPRRKKMRDYINKHVKHREMFRPFAPSILEEDSKKFFDTSYSPYMLEVAKVKDYNKIPSVCHIDKTARVQTVNKTQNYDYYNLINEFKKITGIPCLLNTSFNDHGEPIVETPLDSIICFLQTKIDYLIINDYFLDKKKISNKQILLRNLKRYRSTLIKKNHKKAISQLTKGYNKKNLNLKISNGNKKALEKAISEPIFKMKKIANKIKENKTKTLIIGTNDHTDIFIKHFLPKNRNLKNIDYFNFGKNDVSEKKIFIKNFNLIKNINKKYKNVIISSYEYLDEIVEFLNKKRIKKFITPYDNCSRSLINIFDNRDSLEKLKIISDI